MIANYHTHTWRCGHAAPNEEDYVRAAVDRGMQILGFSDHGPYNFPEWYRSGFRMELPQLEDYVATVTDLRQRYAGQIQIHIGLEQEYYPEYFNGLMPILQDSGVEYLILGQHFVGNEIGERYCGAPTWEASALKRYCAQVMDAMQTGLFTYFAHPDVIHFTGSPRFYAEQMRQVCRMAKQCDMPLEINLLGLAEGRHYPNLAFWELAAEENCPVVLGCDAHKSTALLDRPAEERALRMAELLGLPVLDTVALRRI